MPEPIPQNHNVRGCHQTQYTSGQQHYYRQQQVLVRTLQDDAQAATSIGMRANIAAGLSYMFSWLSGLIIFFLERQNRFVRFHALQSIFFFGCITLLAVLLSILAQADTLSVFASCMSGLLNIVGFIGWLVLMVNGFQGKYFKLPVIGDWVERLVNQGAA